MNEPKLLNVGTEEQLETVKGESGLSSAQVGTEAKTLSNNETSQVGVYVENSNDYSDTSRSLQVSAENQRGQYVTQTERLGGFERSKGDKGVVNTITVDEVKALIRQYGKGFYYTKEQIDYIVETLRKGQYVEVDTEEYPTLEDFLESTGEQGTVYLYPTGDENNTYYQYIWEVNTWVDLGETALDLQNVIRGVYISQADYDDLDPKDENLYYFIPED